MTVNNNLQNYREKSAVAYFKIRSQNLHKATELIHKKIPSEYSAPQTQNRNGNDSGEKPDIFMPLLI